MKTSERGFRMDFRYFLEGQGWVLNPSVTCGDSSPVRELTLRESFWGIRILRFAQNDIGLSLRAFEEGVAIRFPFLRNAMDFIETL